MSRVDENQEMLDDMELENKDRRCEVRNDIIDTKYMVQDQLKVLIDISKSLATIADYLDLIACKTDYITPEDFD